MNKYINLPHALGAALFTLAFTFLGGLDPISAAVLASWGYIFREIAHQADRLLVGRPVFYVKPFFDALTPTVGAALTAYIVLWISL